jgi:hypothetical protein
LRFGRFFDIRGAMVLRALFSLVFVGVMGGLVLGHICNDVLTAPNRLLFKPEKDLVEIQTSGEFRVYLFNKYPIPLKKIRLRARHRAFKIKIEPRRIKRLEPGESSFFRIKLTLREGYKPQEYSFRFTVDAIKEAGRRNGRPDMPIRGMQIGRSAKVIRRRLIRSLRSVFWWNRVVAAQSLLEKEDYKPAIKALKKMLLRDRDYTARGFAARMLGKIKRNWVIPLLKKALKDRSTFVKGSVIYALGLLKAKGFEAEFKKFLKHKNKFIRVNAAGALALLGDRSQIKFLEESLKSKNRYVRCTAAEIVTILGVKSAIDILRKFRHKNDVVRLMAGHALINIAETKEREKK